MIWLCLTMPCSLSIFSLVFRRVFSSRSLFVSLSLSLLLSHSHHHPFDSLGAFLSIHESMNPAVCLYSIRCIRVCFASSIHLLHTSKYTKNDDKKNATSTAVMATTKQSQQQQQQQRYDQVYTLYFISILMDTYTQCMSTVYAATLISALICCCCCLCL